MTRRLSISFSMGETSALMTKLVLERWQHLYDEIVILTANTSEENEESLEFGDWCDRNLFAPLGHRIVWLEALVNPVLGEGIRAKVVTFETASRNGEVFEAFIRKHGLPNAKFKNCTSTLKERVFDAYRRDQLDWAPGTYDTAIGIRADEIDRCSEHREARRLLYPLAHTWPTTKPMVNTFWRDQPRRLELKGYQGNCKWCWKKSPRKRLTLMLETPEVFEFPARMERDYGLVGPEFLKEGTPEGYRRVFFRGNQSVEDLRRQAAGLGPDFVKAPNDADVYVPFDPELDVADSCEESCEVGADENYDLAHLL